MKYQEISHKSVTKQNNHSLTIGVLCLRTGRPEAWFLLKRWQLFCFILSVSMSRNCGDKIFASSCKLLAMGTCGGICVVCFHSSFSLTVDVLHVLNLSPTWPATCAKHRPITSAIFLAPCFYFVFTLHRMHEMQTIVTDDRGVCLSRGSTRLHCAEVIRCRRCQITLASCSLWWYAGGFQIVCAISITLELYNQLVSLLTLLRAATASTHITA